MIEIRETTLRVANAYVEELHRHHGKVVGHKWSLAAYKDGRLCGVAIVGRPTGRYLDNGSTLEVTRLCTDGTRNACSALYAACARRAKREGYAKINNVPEERELALKIGSELVLGCSELWAFGIDHPSAGMAAEIELAKAHGIPVRNGFEAISELKPDEELENSEEDKTDIGSVTLHLPAFRAMAVCNQHLDHGPISIELDGSVILELADRLISDPGVHIEIGG